MPRQNHTPKHIPFIDKSSCNSKRRFGNEELALAAASLQELQNNLAITVYACDRCGGWHLTRNQNKNQK